MKIQPIDWPRFDKLRQVVFEHIDRCLETDGHCKSYEGEFQLNLPNRFSEHCSIELHCYLIGPTRHYEWTSNIGFDDCIANAEKDIHKWAGLTAPDWEEL